MSKSAKSKNSGSVRNECVQVVVRCRPFTNKEETSNFQRVVDVFPSRGVIEVINPEDSSKENRKMFTYDAVYDWNSQQQDVYDEVIRPLVSSVLEGFNGCVFAYGQTGTGKTFTMEGVRNDTQQMGIIPRTFEQIWTHINRAQNMQFLVAVSYLEIYMEELRDLLKPNTTAVLELRERESGIVVPNLHSVLCKSADEMTQVMNKGNKNRTVGRTNMNEHSSRSHAIFQIKIEMCETGAEASTTVKVGKLNLIDLAGSERQSKTGATAERLKEASKINRALSSLGNVISALAEKSSHVPYRDSKLTRLLQDSLGGNSKTIMIANIGPSEYNYNETLTTLRYAHRAKAIQNKPIKNEDPQDAKLREYQEEIARLRKLIEERQNKEKSLPRAKKTPKSAKARRHSIESEDSEDTTTTEENEKEEKFAALDAETKEAVIREREVTAELAKKLESLESKVVRGGENILDTYTERQMELDRRLNEISERKKREIEMQQKLELQEETTMEIRETFTSLQQEVELKTKKLKKCYMKCMALKTEIAETRDEHNRDRRELEMTQNDLIKELKKLLLVIDNFVPAEVKSRLYSSDDLEKPKCPKGSSKFYVQTSSTEDDFCLNDFSFLSARYDEEQEEWTLCTNLINENQPIRRPVALPLRRRPMSDYALQQIKMNPKDSKRFRGENLLNYELDMPLRTTYDYKNPKVSASLQAVLQEAMQTEDDIDITDSYAQQMKMRLDRITRRNVQEPPATAANEMKTPSEVSHPRAKSVKVGAGIRSISASRKSGAAPATAYPKARGLIPK